MGAITFPLADFDIVAPNIGGFIISIADDGALEFLVRFTKGGPEPGPCPRYFV